MLSPRDNYLAMINHESYDYIPDACDAAGCGGARETWENGPAGGGYDDFGLKWLCTRSANGQAVPDPTCHPIPDICEWKKYLKLPDLSKLDWEGMAAAQTANIDRSQKVVNYGMWNHIFLRFSHLLGFEDALCAMYEEPEASMDLMSAITDYKCQAVEYIAKYFKPDMITSYDDVCTERRPFMSPETYREQIKPFHKKYNDCIRSFGILPSQHCCGYAMDLVQDFIDEGAVSWAAVQPTNDIVKVLKEHGDQLCIVGGYDTNGIPGQPGVTDEVVHKEVERMMETYGSLRSFCPGYFLLSDDEDPMAFIKNIVRISNMLKEYRYNYSFHK